MFVLLFLLGLIAPSSIRTGLLLRLRATRFFAVYRLRRRAPPGFNFTPRRLNSFFRVFAEYFLMTGFRRAEFAFTLAFVRRLCVALFALMKCPFALRARLDEYLRRLGFATRRTLWITAMCAAPFLPVYSLSPPPT
jgi:hypothetical protein